MKTLLLIACAGLVLAGTGCTTSTTVQVQRVLGTSTQLQDNSPAGLKAVGQLQALRTLKNAELNLFTNYQALYERQLTNANRVRAALTNDIEPESPRHSNQVRYLEIADLLLSQHQAFLKALKKHMGFIQPRLDTFNAFFATNDAIGLAPRIDWEVMNNVFFLDREKEWLVLDCRASLMTNASRAKLASLTFKAAHPDKDEFVADVDSTVESLNADVSAAITNAAEGIVSAARPGFGDFLNLGVAEIDPSDPAYQRILTSAFVQVSPDSLSMSTSDIMGDANVIIVQESPGQFRTYQISNDPSTLMKNISMLVSKAVVAAAKYGFAP